MSEIQRYYSIVDDPTGERMDPQPHQQGEWVRYDDHEALLVALSEHAERVIDAERKRAWEEFAVPRLGVSGSENLARLLADTRRDTVEECKRAVEAAGHVKWGCYAECECEGEQPEDHYVNIEDYAACAESLLYFACSACCTENGYQTEHCADGHAHGPDKPYCTALAALDGLLGADT